MFVTALYSVTSTWEYNRYLLSVLKNYFKTILKHFSWVVRIIYLGTKTDHKFLEVACDFSAEKVREYVTNPFKQLSNFGVM